MRSRDYLVSLGLVKPGSRGRISKQAQAALQEALDKGMQFSDVLKTDAAAVRKGKPVAQTLKKSEKRREQTEIFGIDRGKGPGHKDLVIAFDSCSCHGKAVQYCTSDKPKLPKWINSKVYMSRKEARADL